MIAFARPAPVEPTEQNWRAAFLPGAYQGTYIDTKHTELDKLIERVGKERRQHVDRVEVLLQVGARKKKRSQPNGEQQSDDAGGRPQPPFPPLNPPELRPERFGLGVSRVAPSLRLMRSQESRFPTQTLPSSYTIGEFQSESTTLEWDVSKVLMPA